MLLKRAHGRPFKKSEAVMPIIGKLVGVTGRITRTAYFLCASSRSVLCRNG